MKTPQGGSSERDLAILAEFLYGSDESIFSLKKKDALELSGRDQKWFAENKKLLAKQIKEKIVTLRLETIRESRLKAQASEFVMPQYEGGSLRQRLKQALENLAQQNATTAMAHRNLEVETLSDDEMAAMLSDIEFLTKGQD